MATPLGGVHMVVCDDGLVLAHGAVVARELEVGDRMFRSGYVEAVAVRPDRQRSGLGSLVMKQVNEHIRSRYEFGALATGEHSFYERLGWQRWAGPSYVRSPTGLARTADEDDGLMVLPTGTSADVDLDAPISCESRRGDDW